MKPIIDGGWLLSTARKSSRLSQAEVADYAELGQSVVSRIENGKQDPGFAELQGILGAAGWRLDVSLAKLRSDERYATYEPVDSEVRQRLPKELRPPIPRLEGDQSTGPTVTEAAYDLGQARALARLAATPEGWLHAAYYSLRNERDRALVHVVLHCGAGASQAAWALEKAIEDVGSVGVGLFGRRERFRATSSVGEMAYAHAALAVRAEAEICALAAWHCQGAAETEATRTRALDSLSEARQELETFTARATGGGSEATLLEERASRVTDLERALEAVTDERDRYYTPSGKREDIGRAGERMLAVAYTQACGEAWQLYTRMSGYPSFERWRRPESDEPPNTPAFDGNYGPTART